MAIKTKCVVICDICGFMVEAEEINNGLDHNVPDTWGHGKNGDIDICPRCAKKLERPEWNYRSTREKGFSYADARKK